MAGSRSFWTSQRGIAAIGLILAVSYFLFMEHRAHILPALPYLILLLCPLMHFFMHGDHSQGGRAGTADERDTENDQRPM